MGKGKRKGGIGQRRRVAEGERVREREKGRVGSSSSVTPRPLRRALRLTSEITVSLRLENTFCHHVSDTLTKRPSAVRVSSLLRISSFSLKQKKKIEGKSRVTFRSRDRVFREFREFSDYKREDRSETE